MKGSILLSRPSQRWCAAYAGRNGTRPSSVCRAAPPNGLPYREMFRTGVNFGADCASIEFPARWLDRPLPGSNESLRFYLLDLVRQARQASDSDAERVRRIIRTQLVGGRPNARRAAALMGVHRRTLARRLSAESLSFKQLTQDLRFEMAREMLSKSNAPMARIAELLGYSDQTVFSRAFSSRFGYPPSRLRLSNTRGGDAKLDALTALSRQR
jgi:AraC-like DNA-binding protein